MKLKNVLNLVTLIWAAIMSISFVACGSDEEKDVFEERDVVEEKDVVIDTTPISMRVGQEKTIYGADTITILNKLVAISSKNVVRGWHVGETTLLVNGSKSISLKVNPNYHLYDDPICNWGCDMNYVKSHQKEGTLSKTQDTGLLYENAGAASYMIYTFENDKLKSVITLVSTNHMSSFIEFLTERYLLMPMYSGKDTYFAGIDNLNKEDAKTVVVMQVYNADYFATIYSPASIVLSGTRSDGKIQIIQEVAELVESLI